MTSAGLSVSLPKAEPRTDLTIALPDGRRLGYAEYGDPNGLPIFGLHGTPGSRLMFHIAHPAAHALNIRLLAPERPGFGISTYHRGRSLASYALDIANFADALGIDRFAVAGVSGGGPYAAACAALLQNRITALGLISPVGPMCGPERPSAIGRGHYLAFRLAPRFLPFMAAVLTFGRMAFLYTPNTIFNLIKRRATRYDGPILARSDVRINLLRGIAEGCRPGVGAGVQELEIFSRPWQIPLQEIRAPALLWQGLNDRNVSVAAALRLGELIPNCQIQQIEGAGHYWIFNNILEVLGAIGKAAKTGSNKAA